MKDKDLHSNIAAVKALTMALINSNTNVDGDIIDTQGFNALELILFSGTLTDGVYTPSLIVGDDPALSDGATSPLLLGTVAGATFTATDDNVVKRLGYVGHKRYVRLRITTTGVTSGGTIGAVAIKASPMLGPTP